MAWRARRSGLQPFAMRRLGRGFREARTGLYKGRHYTTYVEEVKALKRAGDYAGAERLLLALVGAAENEAQANRLASGAVVLQSARDHLQKDEAAGQGAADSRTLCRLLETGGRSSSGRYGECDRKGPAAGRESRRCPTAAGGEFDAASVAAGDHMRVLRLRAPGADPLSLLRRAAALRPREGAASTSTPRRPHRRVVRVRRRVPRPRLQSLR